MKDTSRIVLASVIVTVEFVVLSYVINGVILEEAHERHTFFRSDDDPLVQPGLAITSWVWGLTFVLGYRIFGASVAIRSPIRRGCAYGILVFALFVGIHEVFYYQFIRFEPVILLGGLAHYGISMTLAGGIVGAMLPSIPSGKSLAGQ